MESRFNKAQWINSAVDEPWDAPGFTVTANAPATRQGSFYRSTLHPAVCWLRNFYKIVMQKKCDQRKTLQRKSFKMQRRGWVQGEGKTEHMTSVQASIMSRCTQDSGGMVGQKWQGHSLCPMSLCLCVLPKVNIQMDTASSKLYEYGSSPRTHWRLMSIYNGQLALSLHSSLSLPLFSLCLSLPWVIWSHHSCFSLLTLAPGMF